MLKCSGGKSLRSLVTMMWFVASPASNKLYVVRGVLDVRGEVLDVMDTHIDGWGGRAGQFIRIYATDSTSRPVFA